MTRVKDNKKNSLDNYYRDTPIKTVSLIALGLLISVYGWLHSDEIESFLSKVSVSSLASAFAEEKSGKKDSTKKEDSAKSATDTTKDSEVKTRNKDSWSEEELSLFSKLDERRKQLDLREASLKKLEEELQRQKVELEERLKELVKIRDSVAQQLANRVDVDSERIGKLVDFYSNMKPIKAAKIFEALNEDLAVEVLGRMKKKDAAAIMDLVDSKKARKLFEMLAGYKRNLAGQ